MMRKILYGWLTVILFGTLACRAEETAEPAAPPAETAKAIGLVAIGQIDAQAMEDIRQFVEDNTMFPCRLLPPRELAGGSLDDEGIAAVKDMDASIVFLIAVVMPEADIGNHGVYRPDHKLAVVNAKAIRPENDPNNVYVGRIRRGVMRVIGMLGGLETCPNPQCCMSAYGNLDQLDHIGNNYCPPCFDRLFASLSAMGLVTLKKPIE